MLTSLFKGLSSLIKSCAGDVSNWQLFINYSSTVETNSNVNSLTFL